MTLAIVAMLAALAGALIAVWLLLRREDARDAAVRRDWPELHPLDRALAGKPFLAAIRARAESAYIDEEAAELLGEDEG